MPAGVAKRTVMTFRDARGFTAIVTFYVNVLAVGSRFTHAALIAGALSPLSNGFLQAQSGLANHQSTAIEYGDVADYQTVQDKAEFVFSTGTGKLAKYRVPCPKVALFLADGETLDAGNGLVSAFTSAMLANSACTKSGEPLVRFLGGRFIRTGKPTRLNSITLNPALSGPGW